jgi:hypothetical protein
VRRVFVIAGARGRRRNRVSARLRSCPRRRGCRKVVRPSRAGAAGAASRAASLDAEDLRTPRCRDVGFQVGGALPRGSPLTGLDGAAGSLGIESIHVLTEAPAGSLTRCPLTSTATTTISTPAGRAFPLPSKSSVQSLLHATIFPDSKTELRTSVRMRFMRTPIAHCCIGQRRPKRHASVANRALSQRRG